MRTLRKLLRPLSLFFRWPGREKCEEAAVAILMYHRVTGDVDLELDLPFACFREQMTILAAEGRVVSLDDALEGLQHGWPDRKQRYVVTFDDAYEDFYTHAMPVLEAHNLPATLYVPTGFIESPRQSPVAGTIENKERLTPASWRMLKEIAASDLITIGGHTHSHPDLPKLDDREINRELDHCDALLQQQLGVVVRHFAYPRGIWNRRVHDIVAPRYASVVRVDGGLARSGRVDLPSLPRIPVLRSDGMRWFRHRVAGNLAFEENVIASAKRIVYKARGY